MDQDQHDRFTPGLTGRHLWRHQPEGGEARLFLVPESEALAVGDFLLQTRLGREWRVAEEAALPFEIPREEAGAVLKAEFARVLDEGRKRILDGLDALHRKARQLPPEVQAAPEERRRAVAEAFETLAAGLEKLSQGGARRLRDAAREVRETKQDQVC